MANMLFLVSILICAVITINGSNDLDHQVFSANHFRDLAFEFSNEGGDDESKWFTTKPTLLIMFEPKCKSEQYLQKFRMENKDMPPSEILTYVQYDYGTFPHKIWYNAAEENMKETYRIKRCPTAVFFKKGSSAYDYQTWYSTNSKLTFSNWFWQLLKVDILIGTLYKDQLMVSFEGPGPVIKPVLYNNGEGRNLIVYVGYYVIVTIRGTNDIVHAQLIDWDTPKEKITIKWNAEPIAKLAEWKEKTSNDKHEFLHKLHEHEKALQAMYIKTFKQPLMLGHLTDTGYTQIGYDDDLHNMLQIYWSDEKWIKSKNTSKVVKANSSDFEPWLYLQKRSVLRLPLHEKLYGKVLAKLRESVEAWLQIPLQLVSMQDIHFYPEGSYIRPHVSRADEVITAMLVLEVEDLGSEINLEFRNYQSGVTEFFRLTQQTILMYESATLVISLIDPLKSKQYIAAVSATFKPKYEWQWSVLPDNLTIQMGEKFGILESMDHYQQQLHTGDKPEKLHIDTFKTPLKTEIKKVPKIEVSQGEELDNLKLKKSDVKVKVSEKAEKIKDEVPKEDEDTLKVVVPDAIAKTGSKQKIKEHRDEL